MTTNRLFLYASFLALVAALACPGSGVTGTLAEARGGRRQILIAHRGASAHAPENTLPSFRLAVQMGADFVEYDLQVTKDKQLVCLHDETLDRTTNVEEIFPQRYSAVGQGADSTRHWYVYDFTLEEIKRLDAGAWFGDKYKGTQVPTFQEILDEVRGRAGHLIELKVPEMYNARGVDVERMVLAALKRNGLDRPHADPKTPVIIQSFSANSVQKLALQLKTKLPLHLLVGAKDKDVWLTREGLEKVKSFSTGISPDKSTLTANPQIVTWAHDLGLLVTPYTFRVTPGADVKEVREEMSRYLTTLAVDGVITDNPDQMPRR